MSKYRSEMDRYAAQFKALSNPHRLSLFHRLTTCCPAGSVCGVDEAARLTVGELGEGLDVAPSTVSHHLKELHRAGLVQMVRRGKQVDCWVEPRTLELLSSFFSNPIFDS